MELIVLARKPIAEKNVAENVLAHGTGALNIDGCRVGSEDMSGQWDRDWTRNSGVMGERYDQSSRVRGKTVPPGRWPANLLHDGSEEVLDAFAQFGERTSGVPTRGRSATTENVYGKFAERSLVGGGDTGSAARFFFSAKADADDRCDSKHPTVKPVSLMRWLCRLVTPPGGTVLDPFAGSGTTGVACIREGLNAVLIEREDEYARDIRHRLDKLSGLDTPLFAGSAA